MQKYIKAVDYLEKQSNLLSNLFYESSTDLKESNVKELMNISKNLEAILGFIIRDTIEGKISENEYDIISFSIKKSIERTMDNLRKMAAEMFRSGNVDIYKELIGNLIRLHTSLLKYAPSYKHIKDASFELYISDTIGSVKEKLEKAIARWEEAELTFRGSHAMLSIEPYLLSYFRYNRRRIDESRQCLENAIETSKSYLINSPYRNNIRKNFISSSRITDFSKDNSSMEDTFIEEVRRLQKTLEIESKDTVNDSRVELRITLDENLGVLAALDTPTSELKTLYEKARDVFYKSFDLENHIVLASEDAENYVACLFTDEEAIRKMRICRELSHSPKSIDETFSVTLFQMKIYCVINFLISSLTVGADLKMLNILEKAGNFGYDKWNIIFAFFSSLLAGIIGYKALKNLGDTFRMVPDIYRLHLEFDHIEKKL